MTGTAQRNPFTFVAKFGVVRIACRMVNDICQCMLPLFQTLHTPSVFRSNQKQLPFPFPPSPMIEMCKLACSISIAFRCMFFTKCTIGSIICTPCLCTYLLLKVSHYFAFCILLYAFAHLHSRSISSCVAIHP